MLAERDVLDRVAAALTEADYTVEGVRDLLGPVAGGALARDEIVPALRAAAGGSALELFLRLCWLQVPVREDEMRAAHSAGDVVGDLLLAGLVGRRGDDLYPALRIEPLEAVAAASGAGAVSLAGGAGRGRRGGAHAGYVVSDLKVRPGSGSRLRPDHVVGAGGASHSLSQLVVHRPVDNLLDLGTGCGIQALRLAGRAAASTATDVNPRALDLTRMSFALSGLAGREPELCAGSLFEPVAGRTFDMIVSNPPFVVAPDGPDRLTYREAGLPGDEVCRHLIENAPSHLNDDGWCHFLANWLHIEGAQWQDRVAGWAAAAGCDAWIVQRDVQDPAEYAELWLRDSVEQGTAAYTERYAAWLEHFARAGAVGVGFGWVTLHKSGADRPAVRVEEIRHPVRQPVGAYVDKVLTGIGAGHKLSTGGAEPVDMAHVVVRAVDGLVQEQVGPPGAEHPERIVLRQSAGLGRAAGVGTIEAALAGVCDGTLPLGPLLDAIAGLTGTPADEVRAHTAGVLPELIADGFFEVVG